jgi:hypothetical protein
MNSQRNDRLSEHQLQEILRSLPQVRAPRNLEELLMHRIATEHLNVAHVLASLAPVAAHPEFDERLFKAIQEEERSGLITDPFAGGTSFATWLKGLGWVRGGIAVGAAIVMAIGGAAIHNATLPDSPEPESAAPASVAPAPAAQAPVLKDEATSQPAQAVQPTAASNQAEVSNTHRKAAPVNRGAVPGVATAPVKATPPVSVEPAPVQQTRTPVIEETGDSTIVKMVPATSSTTSDGDDSINTGGDGKGNDRTGGDTSNNP